MTRRVYAPALGLQSWQALLADPEKHWVRGYSAFETAVCWERGARTPRGIPAQLAEVCDKNALWNGCVSVASFPEHRVSLPGGSRASQTDVWTILRGPAGLLSLAVEGKAGESFAQTVGEWRKDETDGKRRRLAYMQDLLGLAQPVDDALRYQLLHRTASAIIEAERIGAAAAAMVVLSFASDEKSHEDYERFAQAIRAVTNAGHLSRAEAVSRVPLFTTWLDVVPATDAEIASVAV